MPLGGEAVVQLGPRRVPGNGGHLNVEGGFDAAGREEGNQLFFILA